MRPSQIAWALGGKLPAMAVGAVAKWELNSLRQQRWLGAIRLAHEKANFVRDSLPPIIPAYEKCRSITVEGDLGSFKPRCVPHR